MPIGAAWLLLSGSACRACHRFYCSLASDVPFLSPLFGVPLSRQEFNWPPCLTIVHFDPRNDPIPVRARDVVLLLRNGLFFAMAILIFNSQRHTRNTQNHSNSYDEVDSSSDQ